MIGSARGRCPARESRLERNGGLAKATGRARGKQPSCEDCFFHKNLLCALDLEEPCATFRPNRPEGLVPPRQPVLLMRTPRWASRLEPAAGLADRALASR
jgi:hypothetical protein